MNISLGLRESAAYLGRITAILACCSMAAMVSNCQKERGPISPPGEKAGGACLSSGVCEPPLVCDAGYCVPSSCQRGAKGCACYADGSCAPIDLTPMSCMGNICQPTAEVSAGSYGAACSEKTPCGDANDGQRLDCMNGRCEQPGCPAGVVGCGCGPYGWCEPFEGQPVRCNVNGVCAIGACIPGSPGCECGSSCAQGLACTYGVCRRRSHRVEVEVGNPDARACDLLLLQSPDSRRDKPVTPVFGAGVMGESVQRLPKIALSFIRRENEPFGGPVARLETDYEVSQPGAYSVSSVACYDHFGSLLENPAIRLSN